MKLQGRDIAVVSNEPWGDIWYSKHNYAFELARRNNRVFFLDPASRWSPGNLLGMQTTHDRLSDNLSVVRYRNLLPAAWGASYELNNRLVSAGLRRFLARCGVQRLVFWSFDPFRLHRPQLLGAELSIFHSVDKYDFRPAGEAQLARSVDHVFCSSESFVGTYRPLNESVHVLPHGISGDEFEAESGHPAELPDSYGLYVGNIDERVDFRLVETALAALPETTFVFVGRIGYDTHNEAARRLFEERKYRNLVATGPIHFKRLRNYIARASFCLAFMNKRVNGNLVGHHKMLQYLALGKPVFGCTLSDYRAVAGLLYMDDDDQALIGRLVGYVRHGEPPGLAAERIAYARRFQFEELLERVDRILFPGASRES